MLGSTRLDEKTLSISALGDFDDFDTTGQITLTWANENGNLNDALHWNEIIKEWSQIPLCRLWRVHSFEVLEMSAIMHCYWNQR